VRQWPRARRWLGSVLLGLALVGAPEVDARRSAEAAEAHAQLSQSVLPALSARKAAARAREQALDAWFGGGLDAPEAALPEVAGLPLLDPAVAWGAVRALDAAAEKRAAERVAPLLADLDERDQERLRAERTATLDAEDAADAKVRRFWLGLVAATEAAPGLREGAVSVRLAELRERAPTPDDVGPEGPSDEVAAAALARGQAEAALRSLQRAAVRAATVPGDGALNDLVQADLVAARGWLLLTGDRSADPPEAVWDAADRLQRVGSLSSVSLDDFRSTWEERRLERVNRDLQAELAAVQARLDADPTDGAVPVEVAEKQVERARSASVEAQQAWEALGGSLNEAQVPTPGLGLVDALALQNAATRVRLADVRVKLAERSVDRARQAELAGAAVDQTTDDDVAKARAEAEAAEAEAERAAEQDARDVDTELRQQIAAYSKRRAEILEERKLREEAARERRTNRSEALTEQRTNLAAALSLGPLDKDRQSRLDDVFGRSRDIVADARSDLAALKTDERTLLDTVEGELAHLPDATATTPSSMDSVLVSHWQDELTKLREALERDRDTSEREIDSAMEMLAEAKEFRRTARTHASADAQSKVQSKFIDELVHELREIPSIVVSLLRQGASVVRHLPALVLDLGAVATFFRGSFELVLLFFLWGVTRERVGRWLESGLNVLKAVRPGDLGFAARINDWVGTRGVSGDWLALEAVATPVLLRAVDGLAGLVVYDELPEHWTMVRLLMFVWLARTAWKLGTELVPVLLVVPGENRPAAHRVGEPGRMRALRTVQVVLGWALLDALFGRFALDILDADRLHDVVNWAGTASGWVLAVGVLHVWSPDLRDAVANDPDDGLGQWLIRQSESVLLRAPLAALALAVLLIRWASRFITGLVEQRSGLAWVATAMARQSLKNTDDAPTQRIDRSIVDRIAVFDPTVVSTDVEAAELAEAFFDWQEEGRRGMAAVTGQRGSGKSRLLRRIPELIGPEAGGLPIHKVRLDRDIFDPADALAWLVCAVSGESEPATDPDAAARLFERLPPTVFVIDDLHRCFLRAVGGFRGLRQVLTAMHAVSDRHFWVCAFHGDNWAYLEGIGSAVNLGVFRARVAMRPMAPAELRDWLEGHTRAAGLTPTYDDLAADGWMGGDPERNRERARNAYFRLLAEATRGNPRVALETWCRSLRRGDTAETAAVVLFDQPDGDVLTRGGDHALFVLSALVVHDGLDVRDLLRVLNLDEATCRATCRRLEGLGVLESDDADEHFDITMAWAPAVHRHLRRKHLLHRE